MPPYNHCASSTGTIVQEKKADKKENRQYKNNLSGESGGTGIIGIIGLVLTETALVKGMVWDVNFALGGEFKTMDELGAKPTGFEVNLNLHLQVEREYIISLA